MNLDNSSVLTLCIFMVVHLCGTVWWMSKINATLGFVCQQVEAILKKNEGFVTVSDHAKDIGHLEKSLDAVWERIDHPHACPNGNCKNDKA